MPPSRYRPRRGPRPQRKRTGPRPGAVATETAPVRPAGPVELPNPVVVKDLSEALGVSHDCAKKLLQRLRQTFERSLGALMVARHTAQHGCPQLARHKMGVC